ncbi:hypothetical protein [Nocardia carnea]|uniref:hypothetical protein n=1 Tax=Nocardia carnea TaxID=37328 RepID=UPI002457D0F6|nr:hypothetical protein [Nocardia carnea]
MDYEDKIPDHVLFLLPRELIGLGMVLVVVAGTASFSFTATLARVAGVPEPLAWLYPVTGGLVVAVIAYSWVTLAGSPYKHVASLAWWYAALLVVFFAGSVAGNVFVITRPPTPMDTLEIMTVVWLPPLCLLCCLFNQALLATVGPARARSSLRESGQRAWAAQMAAFGKVPPFAPKPRDQEEQQPWWNHYDPDSSPEDSPADPEKGDQPEPDETSTAPRVQP